MNSCRYVGDLLRKSLDNARTTDDIKGALNFAFESFDDLNIPVELQWRCI